MNTKFWNRLINGLLYSVFLLPLIYTSRTMYPTHVGKVLIFYIIGDVMLLIWLLNNRKNSIKLTLNRIDYVLIALLAIMGLSTIFSVDPVRSFWGYQERMTGFVMWLHLGIFYTFVKTQYNTLFIRRLSACVGIAALINVAIALTALFYPIFPTIMSDGDRVSGLLGNAIFFGGYLLLTIPFCIIFLGDYLNLKKKYLALFFIVLSLGSIVSTIFLTKTRGSFIGLGIASIVVVLVAGLYSTRSYKKIRYIVMSIVILLSLTFTVLVIVQNTKSGSVIRGKLPLILQLNVYNSTSQTRLLAWEVALKGIKERPLMGWGLENFQHVSDRYYDPRFLGYGFGETVWDKPHNIFLDFGVTAGVGSLVAYVAIILLSFTEGVQIIKKGETGTKKMIGLGIIFGMVGYGVQSFFEIDTIQSLTLFVALCAIASSERQRVRTIDLNMSKKYHKIWYYALALVAVFSIVYSVKLFRVSTRMGDARDMVDINSSFQWVKKAERLAEFNSPYDWENAMFLIQDMARLDGAEVLTRENVEAVAPLIKERLESARKRSPESYQYTFWLSQVYYYEGMYVSTTSLDTSLKLLNESIEHAPTNQRPYLLKAHIYLMQGKDVEAIKIYEELVKQNDYSEVHWFYGITLQKAGKTKEALEQLIEGENFAFGSEQNVLYLVDVYAENKLYDRIIKLYQNLINQQPNNATWYARIAATYAELGDKEKTIENLDKAIELDPSLESEARTFLREKFGS